MDNVEMGERERIRISGVRGWVVGEADAGRTHEREDIWVLVVGGRSGQEAGMPGARQRNRCEARIASVVQRTRARRYQGWCQAYTPTPC